MATLAGCGGSHTQSNPSPSASPDPSAPGWSLETTNYQQTTPKAWTVLVYMGSANDLDLDALANVNQMEHIGSTANINIVVQIKRGSGYNSEGDFTFDSSDGGWTGSRRYYVTKDTNDSHIASELISTNSSADSGKAQTLQDFVQWGLASFPAQRYCLVVWNHGSGWRAEPVGATRSATAKTRAATTRGVSFDYTTDSYIRTTELPGAIDMGGGRKWDLVAIDASLMQMMEVAYQIKDKTSYIVGSEESPPGGGYPYDIILGDLDSNPTWSGVTFGSDIAKKTLAFYYTQPTIADTFYDAATYADYVTQSVVDTSKLPAVAAAFNNLGPALQSASTAYSLQIAAARDNSDHYALEQNDDGSFTSTSEPIYASYHDGEDFLNRLITGVPDSGVQASANAALAALQNAIVVNYHGTSHAKSYGLSFYIPSSAQYKADNSRQAGGSLWFSVATANDLYANLAFPLAAPNWQSFLVQGLQ